MNYQRFENTIIAKIDKGEEVLEQLAKIAGLEQIKLASISALGATNDFTVGVFEVDTKQYQANHFIGQFEIVSLTGTISSMNGEYYAHLHMSAARNDGKVFGGHLNKAFISATCEMVIQIINGTVERQFDAETGLNLLKFVK